MVNKLFKAIAIIILVVVGMATAQSLAAVVDNGIREAIPPNLQLSTVASSVTRDDDDYEGDSTQHSITEARNGTARSFLTLPGRIGYINNFEIYLMCANMIGNWMFVDINVTVYIESTMIPVGSDTTTENVSSGGGIVFTTVNMGLLSYPEHVNTEGTYVLDVFLHNANWSDDDEVGIIMKGYQNSASSEYFGDMYQIEFGGSYYDQADKLVAIYGIFGYFVTAASSSSSGDDDDDESLSAFEEGIGILDFIIGNFAIIITLISSIAGVVTAIILKAIPEKKGKSKKNEDTWIKKLSELFKKRFP